MISQKKLKEIRSRLLIKENGDNKKLCCKHCKLVIANKYNRVEIGERGPYIEIGYDDMVHGNKTFVEGQTHIYFDEYQSNCDHKLFIYYQRKTVAYANYIVGKFYIDPNLVVTEDGNLCITPEIKSSNVNLF